MMTQRQVSAAHPVDADLVEYVVIAFPDLPSRRDVARALRWLVAAGDIRILDLVAVVVAPEGTSVPLEPEGADGLSVLRDVDIDMEPSG